MRAASLSLVVIFCNSQLFCHGHIVHSTQNATIIITDKTLGFELGLIAFLGCNLGGNDIDMAYIAKLRS
jgi:hypothetical protein